MALGSKGGPNTSKLLSHCAPPRMTAWFGSTWRMASVILRYIAAPGGDSTGPQEAESARSAGRRRERLGRRRTAARCCARTPPPTAALLRFRTAMDSPSYRRCWCRSGRRARSAYPGSPRCATDGTMRSPGRAAGTPCRRRSAWGGTELGRRSFVEVEHVAFGHQPVAQIDAAQQQLLAVGRHDVFAVGMHEAVAGGGQAGGHYTGEGDDSQDEDR